MIDITAEHLSAAGTVGAVIVALALPAGSRLRSWRLRPRLELRVDKQEPHVRPVRERKGLGIEALIVRAEVVNVGRGTEARRVKARVQRWCARVRDRNYEWLWLDTDPLPLRWATLPADGEGDPSLDSALPAGVNDYVPVLRYVLNTREVWLCPANEEERPYRLSFNRTADEHRVEIVVTAENAKAVTKTIALRFSSEQIVESVELSEWPTSGVMRAGLFNIFESGGAASD